MSLGQQLIFIRTIYTKCTLQDVENGTNIKKQTISAYEHNRKVPTIQILKKICDFYKVPIDFIVEDYFNSKKQLNTHALFEQLFMFIKFTNSSVSIVNNQLIIKPQEQNLLECIDTNLINNWVNNNLVKNVPNKERLSDMIIDQSLLDTLNSKNLLFTK